MRPDRCDDAIYTGPHAGVHPPPDRPSAGLSSFSTLDMNYWANIAVRKSRLTGVLMWGTSVRHPASADPDMQGVEGSSTTMKVETVCSIEWPNVNATVAAAFRRRS